MTAMRCIGTMNRALIVSLLTVSLAACQAPEKQIPESQRWMPVLEHAQWGYRAKLREPSRVDAKDYHLLFRCRDGGAWQDCQPGGSRRRLFWEDEAAGERRGMVAWSTRSHGLCRYVNDYDRYGQLRVNHQESPELILPKGPWTIGQRWLVKGERRGTIVATAEAIEVPAGRFETVHVRLEGGSRSQEELWFAKGVGLVKQRGFEPLIHRPLGMTRVPRRALDMELTEFWPGSDEPFTDLPQQAPGFFRAQTKSPQFKAERERYLGNRRRFLQRPGRALPYGGYRLWRAKGQAYHVSFHRSANFDWTQCWMQIHSKSVMITVPGVLGPDFPAVSMVGGTLRWGDLTLKIRRQRGQFLINGKICKVAIPDRPWRIHYSIRDGQLVFVSSSL